MLFIKDLAARYWQMVVPPIAATAIAVLLPGDLHPLVRIVVVAALVLTFASGRLYQDRWAQKRTKLQLLHERILAVAREFRFFLSSSSSYVREVSVFQAATQLHAEPDNMQLLEDWALGMAEVQRALDTWHRFFMKQLELEQREKRYSVDGIRLALLNLSHMAVAHEAAIDNFRRVCRRSDVHLTRAAVEKFDRVPPEYNLWVQQFRVLCSDAAELLEGKFQPFALNPQNPLGRASDT